jgi:hypothetical protein
MGDRCTETWRKLHLLEGCFVHVDVLLWICCLFYNYNILLFKKAVHKAPTTLLLVYYVRSCQCTEINTRRKFEKKFFSKLGKNSFESQKHICSDQSHRFRKFVYSMLFPIIDFNALFCRGIQLLTVLFKCFSLTNSCCVLAGGDEYRTLGRGGARDLLPGY